MRSSLWVIAAGGEQWPLLVLVVGLFHWLADRTRNSGALAVATLVVSGL